MENITKNLISSYINGKISVGDLEREHLNPDNILILDESLILKFFEKGLPKNISFSAETLLNAYGKSLSGNAILKLSKMGYIPREKVILISNRHSLPITEPSLATSPKELLDFYSPEVLFSMANKKEITNEFVNNYNSNLISTLSEDEKDEHFNSFTKSIKQICEESKDVSDKQDDNKVTNNKYSKENILEPTEVDEISYTVIKKDEDVPSQDALDDTEKDLTDSTNNSSSTQNKLNDLIFYYYQKGILPAQYTGNTFDFQYIQHKYEKHEITYKNLVELYVNNIITARQFLKLLEKSEITAENLYSTHSISDDVLKTIATTKKTAIFTEAIKSDSLSVESLVNLYLYERVLSVNELQKILIENKITDNLGSFLPENVEERKIEELYTHFLIDYNCLVRLKRENIISEAFFDEVKEKINSDDFYEDLSKITDLYIHTTSDNISASIHHSISNANGTKISMEQEQKELQDMFESPVAREKLPVIHATDLNGKSTSLDGYTCIPMQKYNVVTLKKFETDADTYVMPYQQAAFFLHNSYRPAEFSTGGGFQAEIPLPLEDYNDSSAISVVASTLDYKRDLLETILELSNNEKIKSELFINGKPSNKVEKFLTKDNSREIDF